jgi:heat shock protein beta
MVLPLGTQQPVGDEDAEEGDDSGDDEDDTYSGYWDEGDWEDWMDWDGDGIPNWEDDDDDGDGIPDDEDDELGWQDSDGNQVPDAWEEDHGYDTHWDGDDYDAQVEFYSAEPPEEPEHPAAEWGTANEP